MKDTILKFNPLLRSIHIIGFLFILFSKSAGISFAQEIEQRTKRTERIETAKIAFISKKIELSTEEAEAFWPIYNEMQAEMKAHHKSMKADLKALKADSLSQDNKSYQNALNSHHDNAIKALGIKKEYSQKIGELLGHKKVIELGDAEIAFKKQLMNRMKNTPSGRVKPGPSKGNEKYK